MDRARAKRLVAAAAVAGAAVVVGLDPLGCLNAAQACDILGGRVGDPVTIEAGPYRQADVVGACADGVSFRIREFPHYEELQPDVGRTGVMRADSFYPEGGRPPGVPDEADLPPEWVGLCATLCAERGGLFYVSGDHPNTLTAPAARTSCICQEGMVEFYLEPSE